MTLTLPDLQTAAPWAALALAVVYALWAMLAKSGPTTTARRRARAKPAPKKPAPKRRTTK